VEIYKVIFLLFAVCQKKLLKSLQAVICINEIIPWSYWEVFHPDSDIKPEFDCIFQKGKFDLF
jgi:hypothetical protein